MVSYDTSKTYSKWFQLYTNWKKELLVPQEFGSRSLFDQVQVGRLKNFCCCLPTGKEIFQELSSDYYFLF